VIPLVSRIVEVCVFRFVQDQAEYLVLQRAFAETVHPGMWQIITGTMVEGEHGVQTALRELHEETGMRPKRFWTAPMLSTFYNTQRQEIDLCPVFAAQVLPGAQVLLSDEHRASAWLTYAEARRRLVWPDHRQAVDIVDEYIVRGEEAAIRLEIPIP
jgi:8-oxo-dGTP pyrophosphatase MutT (NUDIX family)